MQQWGFNYWETYALVVNWINVRSISAIASIHEYLGRSIEFVISFPEADLDVGVFMGVPLGLVVYINRVEQFLNLNQSLYGINKTGAD